MASVEKSIEQALKTALQAAISGAGLSASIRASRIDDESASTREATVYPFVGIQAAPAVPYWHRSVFVDVPVEVYIATHVDDDPKRTTLESLYETVRNSINRTTFTLTGYNHGGAIISGGVGPETADNENSIAIEINWKACGVT